MLKLKVHGTDPTRWAGKPEIGVCEGRSIHMNETHCCAGPSTRLKRLVLQLELTQQTSYAHGHFELGPSTRLHKAHNSWHFIHISPFAPQPGLYCIAWAYAPTAVLQALCCLRSCSSASKILWYNLENMTYCTPEVFCVHAYCAQ